MVSEMSRRVVVTGLGAITPIGLSVDEFWASVKEGKIGFGEITKFDSSEYKCHLAAEVKGFEGKNFMDFKAAKRMELFCQYAVAATKEALEDAGITKDNLVMKISEEDFDAVINTNLKGTFNTIKAMYRAFLKQKGGRIINLSSVSGVLGNAGQANYAASKAGVIGLTKSVARELASRNVTVNAVAPGFIATDMTDAMPEAAKEATVNQIPLKRVGQPKDIAETVAFLASEKAAYITGQVISVDGGMAI